MYEVYNLILRLGIKDQYTTTLHALSSAVYKLSRLSKPERVYRGLGGRAIPQSLIGKGVVEYGAQSFTTDRSVAIGYARMGSSGSEKPSYVFEVVEGEIDKGADISFLSYYPHEVLAGLWSACLPRSYLTVLFYTEGEALRAAVYDAARLRPG